MEPERPGIIGQTVSWAVAGLSAAQRTTGMAFGLLASATSKALQTIGLAEGEHLDTPLGSRSVYKYVNSHWREATSLEWEKVTKKEVDEARSQARSEVAEESNHLRSLSGSGRKKALEEQFYREGFYVRAMSNPENEKKFVMGKPQLVSFSYERAGTNRKPLNLHLDHQPVVACLPKALTPVFTYKKDADTFGLFLKEPVAPEDLEKKLLPGTQDLREKVEEYQERTFSVYPEATSGHLDSDGQIKKGHSKTAENRIFGSKVLVNTEALVNGYDLRDVECVVFGFKDIDTVHLNIKGAAEGIKQLGLPLDTPMILFRPESQDIEVMFPQEWCQLADDMERENSIGTWSIDSDLGDLCSQYGLNCGPRPWSTLLLKRIPVSRGMEYLIQFKKDQTLIKEKMAADPENAKTVLLDRLYSDPPELQESGSLAEKSDQLLKHYCQPVGLGAEFSGKECTTSLASRSLLNGQWLADTVLKDSSIASGRVKELVAFAAFYQAAMKDNYPDDKWREKAAYYFSRDMERAGYPDSEIQKLSAALQNIPEEGKEPESSYRLILDSCQNLTDLRGREIELPDEGINDGTTVTWGPVKIPVEVWNNLKARQEIMDCVNSSIDLAYVTGGTPAADSRENGHYRERMNLKTSDSSDSLDQVFARRIDTARSPYGAMVEMQKDNVRRRLAREAGLDGEGAVIQDEYTLRQIKLPGMEVPELMQASSASTPLTKMLAKQLEAQDIKISPRLGTLTQDVLASEKAQEALQEMGYDVEKVERFFIDRDGTPLKLKLHQAVPKPTQR